jgi:HemY protein
MLRLVLFLIVVAAVASGLAWLADRPGELVINWQDYRIETSVFRAVVIFAGVVALSVLAYSILRQLWMSPAALGSYFNRRRQKRGLESLSAGMIAVGAGDRTLATRYAVQARKALPNEPMTHLLRAQAAQLTGDKATARRIFEAMLGSPDTEQLGLRGLFLEAQRESEPEAARQFAERALRLNPKLSWPVEALFDLQCKAADWSGALETLAVAKRHNQIEKPLADRRRAVLLTAQSQLAEDGDPERALALALEAHGLAPDLVPAAAIAGRLLASRGNTPRATKVLQKTWQRSPHPDLAEAYAFARLGDSPRDRLLRVKQLAALYPTSVESSVAIAKAAIEAKDFDEGRSALEGLRDERMSHRVCLLMARIEGEQLGDKGRVREWLARAVNAARDPVWTADGVVSDRWQPVSPVTGQLDAFQWKVAVEAMDNSEGELLARKLDELVALGAPVEPAAPVAAEVLAPEAPAQTPERTDKMHDAAPAPTASRTAEPAQVVASPAISTAAKQPAEPAAASLSCPPARVSKPAAPSAETPARASAETMFEGAAESKTAAKPPAPEAQPELVKAKPSADAATAPAPAANVRPSVTVAPGKTGRDAKGGEPRIFVPPPAPDDPGPETGDAGGDVPAPVRGAYRITT